MGVYVEAFVATRPAGREIEDLLSCLRSTQLALKRLWGTDYEVPVNAGFKALNVAAFKAKWEENWTCVRGQQDKFDETDNEGDAFPMELEGPYGFHAQAFDDVIVFRCQTKWSIFKNVEHDRKMIVDSISLFASSLSSKLIYFCPDDAGFDEPLYEGRAFDAVIERMTDSGCLQFPIRIANDSPDTRVWELDR